jgi:formylglycine-generating enzyme required for sulfatase activity
MPSLALLSLSVHAAEKSAIARFEVTNAEYKAFIDATGYWKDGEYSQDKANHPPLFVSLDDAEAYCAWIRDKTGWKIVQPSAQQVKKAASRTS